MTQPRFYDTAADAAADASNHWQERTARARNKIDAQKDPRLHHVRVIRARDQNFAAAEQGARDAYRAMHATVPSGVPIMVHPQVRERIAAFLAENGLDARDLSLPLIEEGETLDAMIASARAVAEADHQNAVNALATMEREIAEHEVAAAQAKLAAVVATYGDVPAPVAVEPIEPIKRGPGRPARRMRVEDLSQILADD